VAAELVLLYLAPPLLYLYEAPFAAAASAYLCLRLWRAHAPGDLVVAAAAIAIDAALEGALMHAGFYHYARASLGPFPLWLFPLWGALGLVLRRLFRALR
jgi:hypothetical protein